MLQRNRENNPNRYIAAITLVIPPSRNAKVLLLIIPIGIVVYTFLRLTVWDNLCRNGCLSFKARRLVFLLCGGLFGSKVWLKYKSKTKEKQEVKEVCSVYRLVSKIFILFVALLQDIT